MPRFQKPTRQQRVPIVIIGGGIAGLSAAWQLDKRGIHDFVLLEMEPQAGGNSRWGENEISKYPWAAHYVPVPPKANRWPANYSKSSAFSATANGTTALSASIRKSAFSATAAGRRASNRKPAPTPSDHDQYRRFNEKINQFRASGEFTIPMERGAKPSPLDKISMADWLANERFDSPSLRWYINYACRDDYGALAKDTSAWAGIHYFASRDPEEKGPLTWPEGNGWIAQAVDKKVKPLHPHRLGCLSCHARPARSHRANRIHRRKSDFRRSDVSCAIYD